MPLDPEISLKVMPQGQGAGGLAAVGNPLDMAGKFAEIQNRLNQNRLFQQTFAARQKAGAILAGAPDLESGLAALYRDPLVAPFAGEMVNAVRQGMLSQLQYAGEVQTQATHGLDAVLKGLTVGLSDPSMIPGAVQARLATLSPQARANVEPAIGGLVKSLTDGLPSDPGAARGEFAKRLNATLLGANVSPDAIAGVLGKPERIETPGGVYAGVTAPAVSGGGFVASTLIPKTLAPGTVTGKFGPEGQEQVLPIGPGKLPMPLQLGQGGAPAGGNVLAPQAAAPPASTGVPGTAGTLASGPSASTQKFLEEQGKEGSQYVKDLNSKVDVGSQLLYRLQEMRPLLERTQAGGLADVRAKLAQVAQGLGFDQTKVDKIAGGDLAAAQEFQKFAVQSATEQLKQMMTGATGKITNLEFDKFQQNNPHLETDPRAIEKIFNFVTRQYQLDKLQQDELVRAMSGRGFDIKRWPNQWQNILRERGLVTPEQVTGKAKGAAPAQAKERPPIASFFK